MVIIARSKFFPKRSYTFRIFFRDFNRAIQNLGSIRETMRSGTISHKFAEHVMLAVTAVNGCRYCSWVHARMALEAGCTTKEIAGILTSDSGAIASDEAIAIAFAHHYADSCGNPERFALLRLVKAYGLQKSRDILNSIYLITIGNYMGNTLDAFRSRLHGIPPSRGSLLFEFLVFVIGTPLVKGFGLAHVIGTLDTHVRHG
ncbi:MAG TPA: carboxymuconolactone decarboxylase family protein [Candidatus Lokiarchaeia archaeon]|nr:carboxymuconolactone decarboxylase family protein [Candidatus Lokiarchaeia archaeon]